jgi:uncharacterized protein YndB with AHSA1/START domain
MPSKRKATAIKGKTLRQKVRFDAPPRAVYDLLMVSKLHAAFTGHAAKISPKVDGLISAYGDYIDGRNVLLDPGRRIVQAWRAASWPEGWYSTATWEFRAVPGGTEMSFHQSGIPDGDFEDIKSGWIEHYWDRMKAYLKRRA